MHEAPKGARFDSPGRSAAEPWVSKIRPKEALTGAEFRAENCGYEESRPVGPSRTGSSPTLRRLSRLRPGLSNPAPFGALTDQAQDISCFKEPWRKNHARHFARANSRAPSLALRVGVGA